MKNIAFLIFLLSLTIIGCSGGGNLPVTPSQSSDNPGAIISEEFHPTDASDVLYSYDSDTAIAYKAFGIYQVIIDPSNLTAELLPSRRSSKIGDTFDADLTQFLTVTPCYNCIRIDGIEMVGTNQVQVGFAIKHPFGDITKRPDLHAFDVRGIIIADGNQTFPLTEVATGEATGVQAVANVDLVDNPDGFTSHFDELAADTHYFNPPLDYSASINPYKRFFEDGATGAFNPNSPTAHNVFPVGSDWETIDYIFNIVPGNPIDFVFVTDCAYGQSATFQNRTSPYYFLPEFNRKEAWSVVVNLVSGALYSGNTSSSITCRVSVCDWQAGLDADPEFPNTSNLGGIKAKSEVASISIEIPGVSNLVESTGPRTGEGFIWNPYVYNIDVTNTLGASAGNYYGLVAVRDDLNKQRGPIGIPETPAGFPFAGPEIYDYSTYQVFPVRVYGSPPSVTGSHYTTYNYEGDFVSIGIDVVEPDGDPITYSWRQDEPASPVGLFEDPTLEDVYWQAPPVDDIPPEGLMFKLVVTLEDPDGQFEYNVYLWVLEKNSAPECRGITSDPYYPFVWTGQPITFTADYNDPDGDAVIVDWDFDWDGDESNFDVDSSGNPSHDYIWSSPGLYKVGCRLTEDRTNALSSFCSKECVMKGISTEFKIDDSTEPNPGYYDQDVFMMRDPTLNEPVYHVAYADVGDDDIFYCNNIGERDVFTNHQLLSSGPSTGMVNEVCITGSYPFVHVAWVEYDSSVAPAVYRIKINSSNDGGRTFNAFGGERAIVVATDPNYINGLDICVGSLPNLCYIFFTEKASSDYRCSMLVSNNAAETWAQPSGGGFFRDVTTGSINTPFIEVSSITDRIHTFWFDGRAAPPRFYYDYSDDGGQTWHTDVVVSNTAGPGYGTMAVDSAGDAYCTWTDSDGQMYTRNAYYDTPPSWGFTQTVFNLGSTNFRGLDMWVSPNGKSSAISLASYNSGTTSYQMYYFYSSNWGSDYTIQTWSDQAEQIAMPICAGRLESDPNRVEIMTTWVDERVTRAPFNSHIWGNYLYLPEPF
jgi:hypothetical protein